MPKSGERDEYGTINLPQGRQLAVFNAGLRPLRARSPFFKTIVLWTGAILSLALVLGVISVWARSNSVQKTSVALKEELSTHYNPSIAVRFPDIGKQVITSWYAGCAAPISYSSTVAWPGATDSTDGSTAAPGACTTPPRTAPTANPTPGTVYEQPSVVQNVAFLNGEQQSLPTARASDDPTPVKSPYQETLNYLAVYNNTQVMMTVTLGLHDLEDKSQEPVLLSAPTIAPPPTSAATGFSDDPSRGGMPSVASSAALDQQIAVWATAWASSDSASLKQVTQDDSSRVYTGLGGGWRLVTSAQDSTGDSSATPVVWKWGYSKTIDGTKYAVAEVQFRVESFTNIPSGDPDSTASAGQNRYTNYQTMDLLIGKYDTSLPAVVDWGQAGSWSALKPYGQGAKPPSNPADSTDSPTPTPTPTPS